MALSLSRYQSPVNCSSRKVDGNFTHKVKYCWDLRSSGMLRSIDWLLVADVSEQPICPIFNGQAVQETSVTNYQATLRKTPE
jgi:hypothetical protein